MKENSTGVRRRVEGASDSPSAILIAEDQDVIARDMARILRGAGYRVTGFARSPEAVRSAVEERTPDLLLLDLTLVRPYDGMELATSLDVPIVIVSGRSDGATFRQAGLSSVRGFVVKPFTPAQLLASVEIGLHARQPAVQECARAQIALSSIAQTLAELGLTAPPTSALTGGPPIRWVPGLDSLSARESEVLDSLLEHRRPPQIARLLFISPHTVRNHLKAIYAKLGVHSQGELLELLVVRGDAQARSRS